MLYFVYAFLFLLFAQMTRATEVSLTTASGEVTTLADQTSYTCIFVDPKEIPALASGKSYISAFKNAFDPSKVHHAILFGIRKSHHYAAFPHEYSGPIPNPNYTPTNGQPQYLPCEPERVAPGSEKVEFYYETEHGQHPMRTLPLDTAIEFDPEEIERFVVQAHVHSDDGSPITTQLAINMTVSDVPPEGGFAGKIALGAYPHQLILIPKSADAFPVRVDVGNLGDQDHSYCVTESCSGASAKRLGINDYMLEEGLEFVDITASTLHGHDLLKMAVLTVTHPDGTTDTIDTYHAMGHGGNNGGHSGSKNYHVLDKPYRLKKSDRMSITCVYNGTIHQEHCVGGCLEGCSGSTCQHDCEVHCASGFHRGGISTNEEMCLGFLETRTAHPFKTMRFAAPDAVCNGYNPGNTASPFFPCALPNLWRSPANTASVCASGKNAGCIVVPSE